MKRVVRLLIAGGFAAATLAATTGTAAAVATVGDYELTCSSFSGSGTATTDWVTVEVYDWETDTDLVYELVTVEEDGTFSFDVAWIPPSVDGTSLYIGVWASPTEDVGSWDSEDYFEVDETACVPASTTTTSTTAPTSSTTSSTTSTTAGPAVAEAAVVAPAFTG
jgi:hypothetical protein